MIHTYQLSVCLYCSLLLLIEIIVYIDAIDNACCQQQMYNYVKMNDTSRSQCNILHKQQCLPLHLSFQTWKFSADQIVYRNFPIDPIKENYVRQVRRAIFSVTYPVPLKKHPTLAATSEDVVVSILDMDPVMPHSKEFVMFISGGKTLQGTTPLSHRYGGHQFGSWADQLGDGRAVMLGEYVNRLGERWELQLKGSGLTPYSRRGDGRAVVRSSVREFLCSESMYYLGTVLFFM